MKTRYRFVGRGDGFYYWESVLPLDSRHEQIKCSVAWFWSEEGRDE